LIPGALSIAIVVATCAHAATILIFWVFVANATRKVIMPIFQPSQVLDLR
jgi:high-affinity Fe2+/Pb2+ permease